MNAYNEKSIETRLAVISTDVSWIRKEFQEFNNDC